jgi:multiple sugar transport system substrate-binding protein
MRRISVIPAVSAVAAAALVALAGCGTGSGKSTADSQKVVSSTAALTGSITFQTWSLKNDKFTPYFTKLVADFEAAHPGAKVEWLDQPGDGYAAKVTSQVTGGNLPDVVNLPPDIAHAVAKTGGLLDLKKNVPTLATDYVKSGLTAYTYADIDAGASSFGFPWYLGTDVSYWNKEMMAKDGLDAAKPPKTFDELVAQAKIMHDASGGKDFLMSRAPGLSDIANSGTKLLTDDGKKFAFNSAAAAAMIDKYTDAYKNGYMPSNVLDGKYEGNTALFTKGQVAWTTGGGQLIDSMKTNNPTLAAKIVPSPALDTAPLYVQGLSVASKSKNLPLALAFAQFATNDKNQTAFIDLASGFLPGSAASANAPQYSKSDGTPQGDASVLAYKDMQTAINFTPPIFTDAMDTILKQEVAKAITGKESAKEALDNAVNQSNSLLTQ